MTFIPKEAIQRPIGSNTVIGSETSIPYQVANIAALRATVVTSIVDGYKLSVVAYANLGDKGGGVFVYSSSSTATDDGGTVIAPNAGAGRWIRQYGGRLNLRWFGGVSDGATDNLAAMNAAMASFGAGSGGGAIYLGQGVWYFSGTIVVQKQIQIIGAGGTNGQVGTQLLFAQDVTGIHVYHASDSPIGTDGSWSVIRDLGVVAKVKGTLGHGVYISAHGVKLENFYVNNMALDGVHIEASGGAGNSNNFCLINGRLLSNGRHGLFVQGGDANAGIAIMIDCSANAGYGIFENSFLGNTYVMYHSSGNTLGCVYGHGAVSQNVFVGPYCESDQPVPDLWTPAIVFGGNFPPPSANGNTSSYGWMVQNQGLTQVASIESAEFDSANDQLNTSLGGDAGNGDAHKYHYENVASEFRLKWTKAEAVLQMVSSNLFPIYLMLGNGSTRAMTNRVAPPTNGFAVGTNFFIGDTGGGSRQLTTASAAPTTGEHGVGDVCLNNGAASGGNIGWYCTVGGTPGTWVTFGIVGEAQSAAQANSTAADTAGIVADFNSLLAKLRTAKLIAT